MSRHIARGGSRRASGAARRVASRSSPLTAQPHHRLSHAVASPIASCHARAHHRGTDARAVPSRAVQVRRHLVEVGHREPPELVGRSTSGRLPDRRVLRGASHAAASARARAGRSRTARPVVGVELDRDDRAGEREVAVPAGELAHREPATVRSTPGSGRRRAARRARARWSRSPRRTPQPGSAVDRAASRLRSRRRGRARPPGTRPPDRRARSSRRRCPGCGSGSAR